MFSTNLKLTIRNLLNNKVFSLINVMGLAVGLALAMLIGLWVKHELSFDRFHKNVDNIYRVIAHSKMADGEVASYWSVPYPLYDYLKESVPGVKNIVMMDWGFGHALKVGDTKITRSGYQTSPEFLSIYDFPMIRGQRESALTGENNIVLTETLATTLFGDNDPIGQTVRMDDAIDLKVTGVMEVIPSNSSISFNFLVPLSVYENTTPWVAENKTNWENASFQLTLELEEGFTRDQFLAKAKDILKEKQENSKTELDLFAMNDWHLRGDYEEGKQVGGFIKYVRMFGIVGIIVLLIAIINFMNLSTARSEKRAKEVGVRKTLGAMRGQLITQFLGEAMLVAFVAIFIAIGIVDFTLPYFNELTSRSMTVPYSSISFWLIIFGFTGFTGLLAGSYPAFFLSAFRPISTLKNSMFSKQNSNGNLARKVLVVTQFSASVVLIISTIVVWQQINYVTERETGYDRDRLVMINHESEELYKNKAAVDQAINNAGIAESFTRANFAVTEVFNYSDVDWQGKDPNSSVAFPMVSTTYDYTKTLGIKVKQGRDFDRAYPSDSTAILINEAAAKAMSMDNPVGQKINVWELERTIVGVIEDVLMLNPFEPIRPTIILFNPGWVGNMMVRLSPNVATQTALAELEKIFNQYNPAFPFEYRFADQEYAKKFASVQMVGRLATVFGLIAIFISCLGLFGLATFMAEKRTKELGVRKVLGASVMNLWALLSKDFLTLILIACLVATPIAIYIMNGWLADYKYRISLEWWVFLLAAGLAMVIALITISFQSIRAALVNPIESLRNE